MSSQAPTTLSMAARKSAHTLALGPLLLGPAIYVYAQSLVVPSVGALAAGLHISHLEATWAITSYLISGAVLTPIAGRLGDMFGKRRVLLWVLWMTAAGLLVNGLSTGLATLILGRLMAGVSLATLPLAYGIIRETSARERIAPDIALIAAAIALGTGLGAATGGLVIDHLGTHWLFWLPFAITVPTCVGAYLWVPESPVRDGGQVDWIGAATMAAGLLIILVAISESTTWGWGSVRTLGLLGLGGVTLAVWVKVEQGRQEPLIDVSLMARPAVWWPNLTALLFGFGMFGAFTLVPAFAEVPPTTGFGLGDSVVAAGLLVVPAALTMGLGGPIAGRLESRFGSKQPLVWGGLAGSVGFAMLALEHSSAAWIYAGFTLLGLGMGVGYATLPHLIMHAVPHEHTSAATAMNTIARNVGGALGVQCCATVVAANIVAGSLYATQAGYTAAFWVFAAGGIAATVCSCFIPYTRTALLPATGVG